MSVRIVGLLVTLFAFGFVLSLAALRQINTARAATAVSISTSGLINGQFPGVPIKASSTPKAIVKVLATASQAGQTLSSVTVVFSGTGFVQGDLATIATTTASGVALYQDNGSTSGTFDGADSLIELAASPNWGATNTITLTPAVAVSLTNGAQKTFFVAIRTSGGAVDQHQIIATVNANAVVTSDGNGPVTGFISGDYRVDTVAPFVLDAQAYTGETGVIIHFNEPVEKVGGGNLAQADSPFAYVDGGGSAQAISTISHQFGQQNVSVTMDGALDAADLDMSPATMGPQANKIADFAGNVAVAAAGALSSPLTIKTTTIPATTTGAVFTSGAPLVLLQAVGGASPYEWFLADGSSTQVMADLGLTIATTTGKITGTVASTTGSFSVKFKVVDSGSVSSTKPLVINIAPQGGGGIPGITSVVPAGGIKNTTLIVTINGSNTSFSNSSQVEFLMPVGAPGTNGITVNSASSSNAMTLKAAITIAFAATTGSRDVKVTTGGQVVTLAASFNVIEPGGAGLSQLLPPENAVGVNIPPEFGFTQSANATVNSYRVTVKTSSDPNNVTDPIWDYAFPSSTGMGTHCTPSQCNVSYGSGLFNVLKQATALAPNTDYYWQIRSYATSSFSVTSSTVPVETTPARKLTTTNNITDTLPPNVTHQPVFQTTENADLVLFAKVLDNLATPSSTPALTTKVLYCSGGGCTPATVATGTSVGSGYYGYTIPNGTVGAAGTVIRYKIQAFDGTNTANYQQPNATPFQLTSVTAGSNTISGSVKDDANVCAADLQGAKVFVAGAGFSATTNGSCTFSLAGVFNGTYGVVAVRDNYQDKKIDGVAASSTGLTFNLKKGFGGGFGGDTIKPKVKFTGPMDGAMNVAAGDQAFKTFIVFDKQMNQALLNASGNVTVKEFNLNTGTSTDITSKGAWVYYPTAPNVPGVPPESNIAVWTTAGGNSFGAGKTVGVVVKSTVTDINGNSIDGNQPNGDYAYSFTTGAAFFDGNFGGGTFGQGNFIPPHVNGTTPPPGGFAVPINTKMVISFSDPMADDSGPYALKNMIKLLEVSGVGVETDASSDAINTTSLDNGKLISTVALKGTYNASSGLLKSNQKYRLKVLGGAKGANNMTFTPPGQESVVVFTAEFKTSAVSDTAAPTVIGSSPDSGATGVGVNVGTVAEAFDKDMDPSTISTNSIYLSISDTVVAGTVEYRPLERQAVFIPKSALNPNTTYTLNATPSVKGLNGVALAATSSRSFTTGAADTTAPSISFLNADEFTAAVTFTEPMNSAKALDASNWDRSVLNPQAYDVVKYGDAGFNPGSAGTVVVLTGATFSYDQVTNTVIIQGLSLPAGAIGKELYISMDSSGANVAKDLSGNLITGSGNSARGAIKSSQQTKGALIPGAMAGDAFSNVGGFVPQNFATGTFGFAPAVEVRPFSTMAGQTTIYSVRLPISKQIPAGGKIVLSFPTGFDISGAKQDINSPMRSDLNGPGSGTVTFKCLTNVVGGKSCASTANADDAGAAQGGLADDGVVVDATARTITIYLSAATNSEGHDFLNLDIAGIKNSTIPKDFNTSGYTVDVKTKDGTTQLESFTSQAFFIQQAGTGALSGTITATSNSESGTMKVYLMSPMTGPLDTTSADFGGGTTAAYSFSNLPAGQYSVFTDQSVVIGASEYIGNLPQPISVTSASTYSFTMPNASATGTSVVVTVSGPANELVDVFAGSPSGFKVKQVTLNGAGSGSATLKLIPGQWFMGVGPQMPKGFSGPPPAPSYAMPKPKDITVNAGGGCIINGTAGCATTFTLTTASKSIKGTVRDASNKIMANAEVFAYSPQGGIGTHGSSDTAGAFELKVNDGTYIVGAFVPGMPPAKEVPVTVTPDATTYLIIDGTSTAITPAQAASSFILKVAKPDYTISGKVTDGTNVVQGASVFAYRTDAPGHANVNTDSSGQYTLYVSNGTWKVAAFVPLYGQMSEQSVTVAGESVSNINFSPSQTGTFYTVSGRVYTDTNANASYDSGEEISGAFVRISGNSTNNETKTGVDGKYSFNVPAGSNYVIKAFVPDKGDLPQLASFNVSGNVTDKDIVATLPKTITVVFTSPVVDGYMDAFSANGQGSRIELQNATSATMLLPNGSYKLNLLIPGSSLSLSSVTGTTNGTAYATGTGIFVVDGNEGLTMTMPTFRSVTGTVTDGASPVGDAWVEIVQSSGPHIGTKTASNGTFTLQVVDSVNPYKINAMKPGYFREPSSLTVNGSNVAGQTLAMSAASLSISGQIKLGLSGVASAFVRAEKQGGGFAGTQADANGNYTLYVTAGTWKLFGVGEGYAEAAYASNPLIVSAASLTGKDITVSSTVSLDPPVTKPITPATGGTIEDATAGVRLTIPASALGTDTQPGSVETKETNNVRETSSAHPVNDEGVELKATDADGNPLTTFNDSVTVEITYTVAELAATKSAMDASVNTQAEADNIQMAYWDETSNNWSTIASTVTYKDASGTILTDPNENLSGVATVTIAAATDHFSLYAPVVSTDPSAPSTPSGLAAASLGTASISLSWTAVNEATSYDLYRSTASNGTYTRIGSEPTVSSSSTTSYADTGLSAGTTYYYKISALNAVAESAASAAVSAVTSNASGGGSSGGGGGAVTLTPQVATTTPAVTTSTTSTVPIVVTPTSTLQTTTTQPIMSVPMPVAVTSTPEVKLVAEPEIKVQESGITLVGVLTKPLIKGKHLTYRYSFKNTSKTAVDIDVTRSILDANGKTIDTKKGTANLKPGIAFSRQIDEVIDLAPGAYSIRITVIDVKSKKVLGTASFTLPVISSPAVSAPLGVTLSGLPGKPISKGQRIRYGYAYKNSAKTNVEVEVQRVMVEVATKKVVLNKKAIAKLKANEPFNGRVNEVTPSAPGTYAVTVTVADKKTKKLLGTATFTFVVTAK